MKSSDCINLLPIPILGCIVGFDNWKSLVITTAHLWTNWVLIVYILSIIKLFQGNNLNRNQLVVLLKQRSNSTVAAFGLVLLLKYFGQNLFDGSTLPFAIIVCISNLLDVKMTGAKSVTSIGYGAGMACNFFEGYLTYMLPNDGTKYFGFEENIRAYESLNAVRFPVKKLFMVIPKTMFSPPSLIDFNRPNDGKTPYLEACASLEQQIRDIAGVKNRVYKNSAYMIHRPDANPVYLSAECATPLLTLHRVKEHRAMYEEFADLTDADFDEIVKDFCNMLEKILRNSHECRDKCVLVHFNNTDPKENLAEVLLRKIEEIAPNFEQLIDMAE